MAVLKQSQQTSGPWSINRQPGIAAFPVGVSSLNIDLQQQSKNFFANKNSRYTYCQSAHRRVMIALSLDWACAVTVATSWVGGAGGRTRACTSALT